MADFQPDMFEASEAAAAREAKIKAKRLDWAEGHWRWSGPTVGGLVEVDITLPRRVVPEAVELCGSPATRDTIYAYMAEARVTSISSDGSTFTAVLENFKLGAEVHPENGTAIILDILEISPPTRSINATRRERSSSAPSEGCAK